MPDDSNLKEFLNAKAMITPGAAGAAIMAISNTCAANFHIPAKWSALALSLCVALLVVGVTQSRLWQKILLTIFNALFIFATAFGVNAAGATLAQPEPKEVALSAPAAARHVAGTNISNFARTQSLLRPRVPIVGEHWKNGALGDRNARRGRGDRRSVGRSSGENIFPQLVQ